MLGTDMPPRWVAVLWVLAVLTLAVASVALAQPRPDRDHAAPDHWYAGWCCNQNDCRPAEPGEIRWTPRGWLHVPSGSIVPEDRVLSIPDHAPEADKTMMHPCLVDHDLYQDGVLVAPKGGLRCLYKGEAGT